jgi:hypothetical protein
MKKCLCHKKKLNCQSDSGYAQNIIMAASAAKEQ